jgi:hypothetical protein
METTLLHQLSPGDLRKIIREEINESLKPKKEKKYLSKKKASQLLGKTVQTLDAWHKAGILRKKHIGGRVFYDSDSVELLISKTK